MTNGKIQIGYTRGSVIASDLLNESELKDLLLEREAAKKRLSDAKATMQSLGITALQ